MIGVVRLVVVGGLLGMAALALANGLDVAGGVIAAIAVTFGIVALLAAAKVKAGTVTPGQCKTCGGLVAHSAPYCKHCGAQLEQ